MSARALPVGWKFGPHPSVFDIFDVNVLIIGNRIVAEINGEDFEGAVFKNEYPEDVKQYMICRLKENYEYRLQKAHERERKVINGIIGRVRSEMKADESC